MSNTVQVEQSGTRGREGLLRTDRRGVVVDLQGDAATLLGVERGGLTGEQLGARFPGSELAAACRRARESGRPAGFESGDGWRVSGTAYPVDDGAVAVFRADTATEEEQALESLHDIATDPTLTTEGKIEQMLAVGARRLGTAYAFLSRIEDGTHEVVHAAAGDAPEPDPEAFGQGATTPLSATYCRHTVDSDEPVAIQAAGRERPTDPAYEQFGLECYLGATVRVASEEFGTVCFVDPEPRDWPFDEREQTFAELLTNWIHYLLEQRAYERELEQQQAFTESLIDSLPDPLYAFDTEGGLIRWNDQLAAVTGYGDADLDGMTLADFVPERHRERVEATLDRARDGAQESVEAVLKTADGAEIPYEFSGAPLRAGDGTVSGTVGVGRDMTAQTEHLRRLADLLESSRSFTRAQSPEAVAEAAVDAAREVLGFETSLVRLHDPERDALDPAAATDRARDLLGDRPVYGVDEGYPGEVFGTDDPLVVDDLRERDRGPDELAAAMYAPMGSWGTISVGSTEPNAFDDADEHALALLATGAAAACTRARREHELREARAHTERVLDRVNGLVRRTVEVLVEARTREELEDGVVEELAATEPFRFALLARPDIAGDHLEPTAWAGSADTPAEELRFSTAETDPIGAVYREGRTRLLERETLPDGWPWPGLGDTTEALVAVPLVYRDTSYGVLVVCAGERDVLDEREQAVLDALGRASANAINAIERGRILDATEIIELDFSVGDPDLLFSRLSGEGGVIESAGVEPRSDGNVELYLSATDVDPAAFERRVREDPEVASVTCIVAHERECLLEVVVAESLLVTLAEFGAAIKAVRAETGTTRITVELPHEAEARELFDIVADRYPGTELLGYHERERPVETRQDFTAAISDRLTDRQETALRTAYLGGFFDWPRGVDGNELSDAMDISRPTYHQHLRAAQAKVFEELFES